jgi:hypothetical protein
MRADAGVVAQPASAPSEARAESFRKSRRGSIREYGVLSMEYGGGPKEGSGQYQVLSLVQKCKSAYGLCKGANVEGIWRD